MRNRLGTATKIALATVTAAAAVAGLGVTAASASSRNNDNDIQTVTAFFQTITPWGSISIPSLSCPAGSYLQSGDWSPGRIVPAGVEVLEPRYGLAPGGAIGATIPTPDRVAVRVDNGAIKYAATGTNGGGASATNWDFTASHDLLIKLHCTTNLGKADLRG
jgi:hypothetical protein